MKGPTTAAIIIALSFTGFAYASGLKFDNRVNPEYENFYQHQGVFITSIHSKPDSAVKVIDNSVNPEYENFYIPENTYASGLGSQPGIGSDHQDSVLSLERNFFYLGYENMSF